MLALHLYVQKLLNKNRNEQRKRGKKRSFNETNLDNFQLKSSIESLESAGITDNSTNNSRKATTNICGTFSENTNNKNVKKPKLRKRRKIVAKKGA